MPEKSIAERLDRLERAVVELDGHPALFRFGQTRPVLRELIADLEEREEEAKKAPARPSKAAGR